MWLLVFKFASLILLTRPTESQDGQCTSNWFDCGNGKCIAEMWRCDGDNDCGNLNDEKDCENATSPTPKCLSSHFNCKSDNHCIPEKWHCDGDQDCDDGSDEIDCDNFTACTGFTCRDHHCIPTKWYCDGNVDCPDGSDEELCTPGKLCTASEFVCSSGSCIKQNLVCNGKRDCVDGSDEGPHCGDPCENATCSQNCKNTPSGPECFCKDGYTSDSKDKRKCLDVDECLQEGFCSHMCTNTPGSFRCTCQNGYELVNRTCKASGADPLLIFATVNEIRAMRLRSNKYFQIRRAIRKASAVDADPKSQRIYWVEVSNKSSIYSAKTDGSDLTTILSHGLLVPEDIAVDYIANNLYLTDSGLRQVLVCRMDGTMCHVLHDKNVGKPRSIVLDHTQGFLYWSDWGDHTAGIYRSGMDGSRRVPFVSVNIGWPNGIAIDHTTNRLYWADAKFNSIEYISLDGSSRKAIFNATVFHPYSLTVFEDTIYWSDWSSFSLASCNKFTGHKTTLLAKENGQHVMGVHVYHPVLTAKVPNPCWLSECSHMCLISPGSGFRCACPPGFVLDFNGKTCSMADLTEAVFISEGSSVFYMRPGAVGSETVTELPLPLSTAIISKVAFDKGLRFLFVSDLSTPAIHAVNMTSQHMRFLVRNHIVSPEDLSFDYRSNNLYWIDSSKGTVEVISVDSLKRSILVDNLMAPVALAISPPSGYFFVATIATRPSVRMYAMDGKYKKTFRSIEGIPISLALHPTKPLLYWADPSYGTISYVNYTTSRNQKVVTTKIDGVLSVAVSEDYVYWTSRNRELNFMKANVTYVLHLPGQEKGTVTRKVTYSPRAITAGKSECLIGNGGCSYMCLTSPNGRTCACPPELVLNVDNSTCVARRCEEGDFKCMNGQCLPHELRCDGTNNCDDGSDEAGCAFCAGDDFQCKNGACILKSWQCDRRDDCGDNSDEQDCPKTESTCTPDQVACLNGECVSVLWRCDGEKDCEDGTDEVNCNATRCDSDNQYRCDSGQCIPVSWVCDRAKDCLDNSDEKECIYKPKTCTLHEFTCESDRNCIDEILKCDGREDCSDASDEKNCTRSHKDCKWGMFACSDGACIYDYEVCDGHNDCRNNEDENNCTETECQPEEMFCPTPKRCLHRRWICDGDLDCLDGRDEENCVAQQSQPKQTPLPPVDSECKEFYCYSSNECLPWSKVCDGRQDCQDLPDEGGMCSRACSRNGGCSHTCLRTPHGPHCECNEGFRLLPDNRTCDDVNECLQPETCTHFCNNTKGGFKCSCADGYILQNNRHCKADGIPATLVFLLGDQIRGYNLGDQSTKVYINVNNADMKGMDYDASTGVFFWTESSDGSINSYSPVTNQHDVLIKSSSRPVYVRYDWLAKNFYYRDESSRIVACSANGKYCRTLVQSLMTRIDSMDISPTNGYMFWTVWANPHRNQYTGLIERAEMDGSARVGIVFRDIHFPTGITVDHVMNMIYWSDKELNTLECANFHGFHRRYVIQAKMYHPISVAVFEDNVYWADWGSDSIMQCDRFSGKNCTKVVPGTVKANSIAIFHKIMQPHGINRCLNSNCSHLCLPTSTSYVCACDEFNNQGCESDSIAVAQWSDSECPKDHCQGDAKCVVKSGESKVRYICICKPPYSGETCEVKASAAVDSSGDSHTWILAVVFALVVTGMIVLGIFLCIRNRDKLQRVSETVSVKFRSPKSGESRLVMDTDDGSSLCEEFILSQDGDYKRARGNSDYILADSEDNDLKRWPQQGHDSTSAFESGVVNFFRKMRN